MKRTKEIRLSVTRRVVVRSTQIGCAGRDVKQEEARENVIPNDATKDCRAALFVLLPTAVESKGLARLLRLFQGAKV